MKGKDSKEIAIQARASEEPRQAPARPGGSPCCFPGCIPMLSVFPRGEEEDNGSLRRLTPEHRRRLRHAGFAPNNSSCSQAASEEFPWLRGSQAYLVSPCLHSHSTFGCRFPNTPHVLLQLREGAGKGGELNNRRDVEITLQLPPLLAERNLKPKEDPCPKIFSAFPSQEMGQDLSVLFAEEETTAQSGSKVSSTTPESGIHNLVSWHLLHCQTLCRMAWEWSGWDP